MKAPLMRHWLPAIIRCDVQIISHTADFSSHKSASVSLWRFHEEQGILDM